MVASTTGDAIEREAPAKINLWLEVLGKRPDGYHDLQTIMQTVDFSDVLRFRSRPDGAISLHGEAPGLPPAEDNLVVRAARSLKDRTSTAMGVDIELTKNIPIGAGLGGGSSDCASTLLALRDLWDMDIGYEPLLEIASELGSDIPFFLHGGTAICEGRGERVRPLEVNHRFDYVLILPDVSVSTPEVYDAFEPSLTKEGGEISICTVQRALESGDKVLLGESLYNDLQETALQVSSEIKHAIQMIRSLLPQPGCLGYSLSGSGAAFFAVCEGAAQAASFADSLQSSGLPAIPVRSRKK